MVVAFDPTTGLGEVTTASGERLSFHATSISDATRMIPVGTAVVVERRATHGGRIEAAGLTPLT